MLACPNKNNRDWKVLVEQVGEYEAFRQYIERGDGSIPSLEQESFIPVVPTEAEQKQELGEAVVYAIANRFAENLGVKGKAVTREQARDITSAAQNPWNGESAFFYDGTIYFVEDGFNLDNVLHEYSHPLVSAIAATNKPLFDKLYEDLLNTAEGQIIQAEVEQLGYKSEDPLDVQKEIMVRALAKEAQTKLDNIPTSNSFKDVIKRIVFAIKQALRKVFGTGVKVEKLSTDTTLQDLGRMLTTENFVFDVETISDKEYVEYSKDYTEFFKSLDEVENSDISVTVSRYYDLIKRQINQVFNNKNYAEARKVLIDEETGGGLLREIKKTLETTPEINERLKDILNSLDKREKNAKNLVHALMRFDILTQKISSHLNEVVKNPDSKEVLNNVFYYDLLVRNWSKFIQETNERLIDGGMDPASALGKTLSTTQTRIESIQRRIQKAYGPGIVDVLYDHLSGLREGIDKFYTEAIDKAKAVGSKKREEDMTAEYEKVKLTKERLAELLSGKAGDTNVLSAWFEDATNSPDPIVGGFATLIKNGYNEVDAETQRNINSFMRDMAPLLRKAGYSMTNFTDLMDQLSFKDKVVVRNIKTGEVETKEYLTLLNPFKDTDSRLKELKYAYEDAIDSGKETEADGILKQIRQHKKDYFHQEYVSEFYEREDIYDSLQKNPDLEAATYKALGVTKSTATAADKQAAAEMYDRAAKDAYRRKYLLLNSIEELDGANYDPDYYDDVAQQKKALWKEYTQLASLTNSDGSLKTGEEYLTAAIERKYRKESNKFFEWVPIQGAFEFALDRFEQSLIDEKIAKGSDEFIEKRNKWIADNTVVKFTKEFYQERARIFTEIKDILSRLPENIRLKVDSTGEFEEIIDATIGFRDNDGQIIGSDIADKAKARIKKLQQDIQDKKDSYAGFSGLSKDELEEIGELYDIRKTRRLTPEESFRLNQLNERKSEFGVDKATQIELGNLYRQLGTLQSKDATDYYVDIVNNWFGKMGVAKRIDGRTAGDILLPGEYVELFKQSAEFKQWFEDNHIRKEVFDPKTKQNIVTYERLYIWNKVRPNDPEHFERITLASGEVIDGSPNLSYFFRRVKNEYKTEKIVGKTVDNKGNFLPKTLAEGAKSDSPYFNEEYNNLKRSDPAKFAVLEKMKEYHLKFQEKIARESRLYLQVPRYGTQSIENAQLSKNISAAKRWYLNLRKGFFKANDDYDRDLNFNPGQLVNADMFDEEFRKVPITGLYDMKTEEVSRNYLDSMMRYMHSGLMQRKLIELNPFAQALQSVVTDPKNSVSLMNKFIKWRYVLQGKKVPIKQEGQSVRAKAIRRLFEREFEGKRIADGTADYPFLWKLKNMFSKIAGTSSFALNLPSALKNRNAAVVQGFIEASGGRFLDYQSYVLGKARAFKALTVNATEIYKLKNKSLDVQLMQIFDPSQKFFAKSIKTQFGRSMLDDAAKLSFLMSPREFLQLEATAEVMFGMLYHQKVKQTINGQSNEISYINAFHIVNGQIELKPGIDPEYAPGAKKFNEIKNMVHEIGNRLEGNYGRFGQPEINRYYLGQTALFFKKYFTSMFMNHFAYKRTSAALGTVSSGNYIAFLRMIKNFAVYAKEGENYYRLMDADEASAARKVMGQIAAIATMYMALAYMFEYDDEDDDRFKKVANRSAPLGQDGFNLEGWVFNHLGIVTLTTLTEVQTFSHPRLFINTVGDLPNPKVLWEMGIKLPYQFIEHSVGNLFNQETSYYAKTKEGAAYPWQEEGASKAIADLAKMFGLTGSTLSPRIAIESAEKQRKGQYK
jgi:hypothetical protein